MADAPEYSKAHRAGRIVQAFILAVVTAAVVIQLLHAATEMTFRYGGF